MDRRQVIGACTWKYKLIAQDICFVPEDAVLIPKFNI